LTAAIFIHSEIYQPFCLAVPLSLVSKDSGATEVILFLLLVVRNDGNICQ